MRHLTHDTLVKGRGSHCTAVCRSCWAMAFGGSTAVVHIVLAKGSRMHCNRQVRLHHRAMLRTCGHRWEGKGDPCELPLRHPGNVHRAQLGQLNEQQWPVRHG